MRGGRVSRPDRAGFTGRAQLPCRARQPRVHRPSGTAISSSSRSRAAWDGKGRPGYTTRARAETAISRFKRVIGDGLCSHTEEGRATEVDVAIHVLNRML